MNFDFQRFVSDRDGPNVRQSFDAVSGNYESGPWKFIAFYSHPVQIPDKGDQPFIDYSSGANTFSVVRVQRDLFGWATLSGYYARYTQDNAKYLTVSGDELRDAFDIRFAGVVGGFDGDLEVMGQTGSISGEDIRSWAVGSLSGYTFSGVGWTPRLGFQFDAASGDSNRNDNVLQTFNPLFPNGFYFSLAGYTGYTNLIHVKPSLTLHPTNALKLTLAVASPVARNHGRCGVCPGRYSGARHGGAAGTLDRDI